MKKIRKAIFPVGGLGTRFLPATKAMPKEMLPVVDKPLIQYAVEEATAAGIEEFIFVTGRGKAAIEDHFDHSVELESMLQARGNKQALDIVRQFIKPPGSISYIRQQEALGLGHAVWCARHLIHDEPFAVLSADDFMHCNTPCLKQMVDQYTEGMMVAVANVPIDHVSRYGILDVESDTGVLVKARAVIEKPSKEEAPSNVAIVGRYILPPAVLTQLSHQEKGIGGEIQLTDSFIPLLKTHDFYGLRYEGTRYDCGSKAGLIAANVAVALTRDDLRSDVLSTIREVLNENDTRTSTKEVTR